MILGLKIIKLTRELGVDLWNSS